MAFSRPPNTFRWCRSGRRTTAGSRHSATTPRPRATPRSPRSARASSARRWRRSGWERIDAMASPNETEEELLRTVAIQNAHSILLARQRAEQDLVAAKEALEL